MVKTRRRLRRLRRRTRRRVQKGGQSGSIVYYTCFFGPDGGVGDAIPTPPSATAPCFYFSNNAATLKSAAEKGWKTVNVPVQVKATNRNNAVDSKELKACPHRFKELQGFTYSCYFDSKMQINESAINSLLPRLTGDVVMLVTRHINIKNSVWNEYAIAMQQPRYSQDSEKYKAYIERRKQEGLSNSSPDPHYQTGFILRKSGTLVDRIGEEWYRDIMDTGAECQISFFFIKEKYKKHIAPVEVGEILRK